GRSSTPGTRCDVTKVVVTFPPLTDASRRCRPYDETVSVHRGRTSNGGWRVLQRRRGGRRGHGCAEPEGQRHRLDVRWPDGGERARCAARHPARPATGL